MKSTRSQIVLATAVFILAVAALLGRSRSVYVCPRCGALEHQTEWFIPFTSVCVVEGRRQLAATPVSTTVAALGVIDRPTVHEWMLVHAVGNGAVCALGSGSSLYLSVKSQRVAELFRAAHETGDIGFRDELVRRTFRRDTSFLVYQLADSAPASAFADAEAFSAWRRDKAVEIQKLLQRNPPNQAMQLTASKPDVRAWRVCRRERILRAVHRGLAAADLVSR